MALIQFFFLLLHGSVVGGLLAAPFAPLSLPYAIYLYLPFGKFALKVAIWVAPWVAAAVALCLARPGLREWSLAIPLVFGLAVSIPVGEWQSKRAMCEAASNLGFSGFRRNSFSWSLSNRNQDWQWEIHGFAVVGGQRLGWSYREMDWFSIPGDTGGEVLAAVFECPSDI